MPSVLYVCSLSAVGRTRGKGSLAGCRFPGAAYGAWCCREPACRRASCAGREGGLEEPSDFSLVCPHPDARTLCVNACSGLSLGLSFGRDTVVPGTFSRKLLPGGVSLRKNHKPTQLFHSCLHVVLISLSTRIFGSLHGECLPLFFPKLFRIKANPRSSL